MYIFSLHVLETPNIERPEHGKYNMDANLTADRRQETGQLWADVPARTHTKAGTYI